VAPALASRTPAAPPSWYDFERSGLLLAAVVLFATESRVGRGILVSRTQPPDAWSDSGVVGTVVKPSGGTGGAKYERALRREVYGVDGCEACGKRRRFGRFGRFRGKEDAVEIVRGESSSRSS